MRLFIFRIFKDGNKWVVCWLSSENFKELIHIFWKPRNFLRFLWGAEHQIIDIYVTYNWNEEEYNETNVFRDNYYQSLDNIQFFVFSVLENASFGVFHDEISLI